MNADDPKKKPLPRPRWADDAERTKERDRVSERLDEEHREASAFPPSDPELEEVYGMPDDDADPSPVYGAPSERDVEPAPELRRAEGLTPTMVVAALVALAVLSAWVWFLAR